MKARTVGEVVAALLAGGSGVGVRLPASITQPGRGCSEAEFQAAVIALARSAGYLVAHFAPARVVRRGVEKYETPVRGDGRGFPDLVLAKATPAGPRVLLIELKAEKGVLSEHQRAWAEAAGVLLFRPSDWPAIVATLTPPPAAG